MTTIHHKEILTRKDRISARAAWGGILFAAAAIVTFNQNNAPKDSDLIHLEASGDPRLQNISTGCQVTVINAAQTENTEIASAINTPSGLNPFSQNNPGKDFNTAAFYQKVNTCIEARVAAHNARETDDKKLPVPAGLALLASLGIGGYGLGGALTPVPARRREEEDDQPTPSPS
ncbi:MAG: hypothetical protein H6857_00170 [Rhodospirillales bacterium]|nr:hypothetical protein [Rhodospirillales bacterium]